MRYLIPALLLLSLPAGVIGYTIGVWLVSQLPLPSAVQGIAQLFIPLLIGGLCMAPFVAPFFDRMAKRDLAALERQRSAASPPCEGSPRCAKATPSLRAADRPSSRMSGLRC